MTGGERTGILSQTGSYAKLLGKPKKIKGQLEKGVGSVRAPEPSRTRTRGDGQEETEYKGGDFQ